MPVRPSGASSLMSCTQSSVHEPPWPDRPEYSRFPSSSGALPSPANMGFAFLPQLSNQSSFDSTSVPSCFPSFLELSSFLPLPSTSPVPSLSLDYVPFPENHIGGPHAHSLFPAPNSFSSVSLHFPFSELLKGSSAFLASLSKGEPNRHPFSQGFSQMASWAGSLHSILGQKPLTVGDGDEARNFKLHWSKGLSPVEQEQQNGREREYLSIGLPGREIRGVEKMSISQVEASLVSEEQDTQCGSRDAQSGSKAEPFQKHTQQDNDAEKNGVRLAASETAFKTTKHLLAGVISAVVSRTLVAPLERLKLEYMVRAAKHNVLEIIRVIVATEGIGGFWRGNVVNLLRTAPFKSVNFFCYDVYRKKLLEITGNEEATNLERLFAGAAAGITATLLCFPMDTIRTRMVAPGGEALGGVIGCFQHMLRTEGFFSLYKGLVPAVISMAPSGAVFYGVYDILKTSYLQSPEGQEDLRRRIEMERERRKSEGKMEGNLKEEAENLGQLELGPMRTLLYGAIAGICAETVTYPFEVVRRQLQMQDAATRMGALATCQGLVQRGGLGALYAGLLPSSLQVLPSAALSYFVYETMKIFLKVS